MLPFDDGESGAGDDVESEPVPGAMLDEDSADSSGENSEQPGGDPDKEV